jgi:hypothetical protein
MTLSSLSGYQEPFWPLRRHQPCVEVNSPGITNVGPDPAVLRNCVLQFHKKWRHVKKVWKKLGFVQTCGYDYQWTKYAFALIIYGIPLTIEVEASMQHCL